MKLLVKDAARLLDVSEKTIYRWIKQGSIPAYRLNEQYRFNRAELLEWATSRRIPVSPEIFREEESEAASLPHFAEALRAGGIHYRIGGDDKSSVLHHVVEAMRLPPEVDREFLFEVLLAREALGSTAIGDGIAIPHVRNPVILHLERPMITLCFLERPVDFGSARRSTGERVVHGHQPDGARPPASDVEVELRAAGSGLQGRHRGAGGARRDHDGGGAL